MATDILMNDDYTPWGEKKIGIDELIKGLESKRSQEARDRYLTSKIKTIDYINFEVLTVIADSIVANSMFDKDGNIKIDSCKKYLLYVYSILNVFTNIDVHEDKWVQEYNKLNKSNLIEVIVGMIPERIVNEFDSILKMKSDDLITNYYSINAYIDRKLVQLYPVINKGIDGLLSIAEQMSKEIDLNALVENFNK